MTEEAKPRTCYYCGAPYEPIPLQPTEVGGVPAVMAGFSIRHKDGCPEATPQSCADADDDSGWDTGRGGSSQ